MTWERRYVADSKIMRHEAGTWKFPIALDCLYEIDCTCPTLNELLTPWTFALSMHSAFLHMGSLKCIYDHVRG